MVGPTTRRDKKRNEHARLDHPFELQVTTSRLGSCKHLVCLSEEVKRLNVAMALGGVSLAVELSLSPVHNVDALATLGCECKWKILCWTMGC